jgi:hypothetical protein
VIGTKHLKALSVPSGPAGLFVLGSETLRPAPNEQVPTQMERFYPIFSVQVPYERNAAPLSL